VPKEKKAGARKALVSRFLRQSRHIEHRFHYVFAQQVQQEYLTIHFIPGKDNPADILTKLLPMSSIAKWKSDWPNELIGTRPPFELNKRSPQTINNLAMFSKPNKLFDTRSYKVPSRLANSGYHDFANL